MADRVTSSAPQEKSWSAINNIKCQTDRTKALAATKYRKLEISGLPRTIQTGYSAKTLFLCICQFWKPKRTNFKLNFSDPKPFFWLARILFPLQFYSFRRRELKISLLWKMCHCVDILMVSIGPAASVTRLGKISPLWPIIENLWQHI